MNVNYFWGPRFKNLNIAWAFLSGMLLIGLVGCDSGDVNDFELPESPTGANQDECFIPPNEIVNGGPGKDGIPALTNPELVGADAVSYLNDEDRIIGMFINGVAVALPHNILWWHEIINYSTDEDGVAITYCPLTGSSIVFDRSVIGGAEFGVSGLLYNNNLIMYDRNETESLWSQMITGSGCESNENPVVPTVSHVEMTWAGWKMLHPDTRVIAGETGFPRNYEQYPYGNYEELNNVDFLFRQPELDRRRPPKERVLGIPDGEGGAQTYPFGLLDQGGEKFLVRDVFQGEEIAILWNRSFSAATAFYLRTDQGSVNLQLENGQFVDADTGSTFTVDGWSTSGEREGERLQPVDEAYVAFWFAWPAFHPETTIMEAP